MDRRTWFHVILCVTLALISYRVSCTWLRAQNGRETPHIEVSDQSTGRVVDVSHARDDRGPQLEPSELPRLRSPLSTSSKDTAVHAEEPLAAEPFPTADVPIRDVLDAYRERAAAGDDRAACWLGHQLALCTRSDEQHWYTMRQIDQILASPNMDRDDEEALPYLEEDLGQIQRCLGIGVSAQRMAYPLLRQAALAGSLDAISTLSDNDWLLGPGMPDSEHYRQAATDVHGLLWAGIHAGSLKSFRQLAEMSSQTGELLPTGYSARSLLNVDERLMLYEVMQRLSKKLRSAYPDFKNHWSIGHRRPVAPLDAYRLNPQQSARADDIVEEIFAVGWSDINRIRELTEGVGDLESHAACEQFTIGFNPAFRLNEVLRP